MGDPPGAAALNNLDAEIYNDWWHANHAWHSGDTAAAHHLYKNLRANHSIELFYEIQLMRPTRFIHPLGTVLGRAKYAAHLVVYQGVSVGSTVDHEQPTFTGPCVLFPHSGVIGPVTVGKNVWITAGVIVDARPGNKVVIPDNTVVSQAGIRSTKRSVIERFFPERD